VFARTQSEPGQDGVPFGINVRERLLVSY
jgi:hypothetical protein